MRRQIAAYETAGELNAGGAEPGDVIDGVMLQGYRQFVRVPEQPDQFHFDEPAPAIDPGAIL